MKEAIREILVRSNKQNMAFNPPLEQLVVSVGALGSNNEVSYSVPVPRDGSEHYILWRKGVDVRDTITCLACSSSF